MDVSVKLNLMEHNRMQEELIVLKRNVRSTQQTLDRLDRQMANPEISDSAVKAKLRTFSDLFRRDRVLLFAQRVSRGAFPNVRESHVNGVAPRRSIRALSDVYADVDERGETVSGNAPRGGRNGHLAGEK